jgi:hypothetical protein
MDRYTSLNSSGWLVQAGLTEHNKYDSLRGEIALGSSRLFTLPYGRMSISMARRIPKQTGSVSKIASETDPGVSRDFFGPPPLIPGEDPTAYEMLLARITEAVEPKDVLEEIWVREMVDLEWAVLRWRRLKANLFRVGKADGAYALLRPSSHSLVMEFGDSTRDLSDRYAHGDVAAVKEVNGRLDKAGLTIESIMAQTLVNNLDSVERIDRMLASAEARRDAALRELDRHRAVFSAAVRDATSEIDDADFAEIAPTVAERTSQ